MKRLSTAGLLSLLLLWACDGGTGPAPVALVSVYQGSVPVEEITVRPGTTVTLRATPLDEARRELTDRPVAWASSAPQVATVGEATGAVTAVGTGTALVTATSEGIEATVRVNVALPVDGSPGCAAGDPGVSLAVGEVRTFSAFEAVDLCLSGGEAGADFTLVAFNAFSSAVAQMRVELRPTGTVTAFGLTSLSPEPAPAAATPPAGPRPDLDFHQRLNDRMHRRTEGALRSAPGPSLDLAPGRPLFAVPTVGAEMRLNVQAAGVDGCQDPDYRTGRVHAVTDRAVVVADVENPAGGFTDEDYLQFGRDFDRYVWPVVTSAFGEPSDVDGNGRAVIFFTRAVNELTGRGTGGSYVGGYFYNRDLFTRGGASGCEGSNEGEILYMLVPDPAGTVNGNRRSVPFVRATTMGVLAHEFQHLINDSRRLHVNRSPVWEERWLNEGLSHVAEELMFYHVTDLGPGRNLSIGDVSPQGRVQDFTMYGLENVERLIEYLERPEGESTLGPDNLATRGAAWAFLRYAADRKAAPGAPQRRLWYDLANSRTQGVENLRQVLGTDPMEWLRDWAVSLYTDDAGIPGLDARYTQPSWDFRRLIPGLRFAGIGESLHTRYPLPTHSLARDQAVTLDGGGAAYYRFAVPAEARGSIRTTVGGLPAPSRLRLSVVRTR